MLRVTLPPKQCFVNSSHPQPNTAAHINSMYRHPIRVQVALQSREMVVKPYWSSRETRKIARGPQRRGAYIKPVAPCDTTTSSDAEYTSAGGALAGRHMLLAPAEPMKSHFPLSREPYTRDGCSVQSDYPTSRTSLQRNLSTLLRPSANKVEIWPNSNSQLFPAR